MKTFVAQVIHSTGNHFEILVIVAPDEDEAKKIAEKSYNSGRVYRISEVEANDYFVAFDSRDYAENEAIYTIWHILNFCFYI